MSAIAENVMLSIGESREIKPYDGITVTLYPIVVKENEVVTVTKHSDFWSVTILGDLFCGANGNGKTPAEAMAAALTSGVARMADAFAAVRALAVERGNELVALAKGLA